MPTLERGRERAREHRRGVREGRPRADPVLGHDRLRDRRDQAEVDGARRELTAGPASAPIRDGIVGTVEQVVAQLRSTRRRASRASTSSTCCTATSTTVELIGRELVPAVA